MFRACPPGPCPASPCQGTQRLRGKWPRGVVWQKAVQRQNSLCPQHQHGTVPPVLPQGMQEGDGSAVQQGRAPVPLLMLAVYQLQDHLQAAPLP